jgi:hypothetical protein
VTDLAARQGTDFAVTLTPPQRADDGSQTVAGMRMLIARPGDSAVIADLTLGEGIADVNGVHVAAAPAAQTALWPAGRLQWEAKVRFDDGGILDVDSGSLRVEPSRIGADV